MRRMAIVTAGGDAPGMNAAIRAIVRRAVPNGLRVLGFERGFEGLITNSSKALSLRSVGGIIHLGGTILRTARCPRFENREGVQRGAETLRANNIDGLIVIGGEGSLRGALELSEECDAAIIGVPATIDNDVYGTDETIGFDTAVNTALEAIDRIRYTAVSHDRIFVIEVMGRTRGFLALEVGFAAGAELILVPEAQLKMEEIFDKVDECRRKGKRSSIIVAAEGFGNTERIAEEIRSHTGSDVRLSVLGYIQRGGSPTARSRRLGNLFGSKAVELLLDGERSRVVGLHGGTLASEDLRRSCESVKPLDLKLLRLAEELAV